MPSKVTVRAAGLCPQPSDMTAPDGALATADNVVVSRDNIVETRRGYSVIGTKALSRLFAWRDALVGHGGSTLSRSSDSGATWTDYGTLTKPSDTPVRVAEASSDLFLTASDGIKRLDAFAGALEAAGVPAAPDINQTATATGSAIANNSQVAYRVVFGKKDANGRLILGAPSGRVIIVNTSGSTKAGNLWLEAAPGLSAQHFVQVYRSPNSNGATTAPSDEMQLALEFPWPFVTARAVSIQRASNTVTVTTNAAHGLTGTTRVSIDPAVAGFAAYTGAISAPTTTTLTYTQTGSDAGPIAVSATIERLSYDVLDDVPDDLLQSALYTNETQEGINQQNDVPPIARDVAMFRNCLFLADIQRAPSQIVTLIAKPGGADTLTINGVTFTFEYAPALGGTPQENVAYVARYLAWQINETRPLVARAWYVSGADDPAGRILIAGLPGDAALTIVASNTATWLPSSLGATAERMQNAVAWSKQLQPDAVPALNYTRIASADLPILRIIPTRDSLFVLKKEDGVFRITGDSPETFRVDPFDYNTHLVGPETARALDNKILMLTEQGVVAVTDTGVELVSRSIETLLQPLLVGAMRAVTESLAFGVAVESDRKYILFLPTLSSDTACTQALVYDLITQAWTRWAMTALHGLSNPAGDRLYFVDGTSVLQERKALADADHQDASGAAISEAIEWTPQFAQPGMFHEFQDVVLSFRRAGWTSATVSFATDLDPAWEAVTLPAQATADHVTKRIVVPRNKARGSLLRVKWSKSEASAPTRLQALTVNYVPGTVPAVVR